MRKNSIILNLVALTLQAFITPTLFAAERSQQFLQAEKNLADNKRHQAIADQNGGIATSCRTESESNKEIFETHDKYQKTFYDQNLDKIRERTRALAQDKEFLNQAETLYKQSSGETSLDSSSWFAQSQDYQEKIDELGDELQLKQSEYNTLASKCSRFCTSSQKAQKTRLQREIKLLQDHIKAKEKEFQKLSKKNSSNAQNASNQLSQAKTDIDRNDALMARSHSISGCNSETGHSSNTECILSGPLVEKDQELTNLMNSSIDNIKSLTQARQKRLLELELEKQYNGDYELYEIALADLDENKENSEVARSNLDVMAMASAAIKNLECRPHPLSDADSKSYHLFKAASATYLASQINDTSYYTESVRCRTQENYTQDETNLQYRTVERAANVVNAQFENLCLRITPNKEHLKKECDQYLNKIRGPEYASKPKTREQALIMYQAALEAALEEQNAKREKIAIATANVEKGKKWVETATNRIIRATAIMVAHYLLKDVYAGISNKCKASQNWPCAAWGMFMSAKESTAAKVIGGLISAYYVVDLIRAKKFLAKWEKKLKRAYHFTHLACNFKDAQKEQTTFSSIGSKAKESMQEELREKRIKVLNDIDSTIYDEIKEIKNQTSMLDFSIFSPIQNLYAKDSNLQAQGLSMAIAPGSTSFEYFLSQRSAEWMEQANDITTSENFKGSPYLTPKELGKDFEALEEVPFESRVGFPIPETRTFLLQKAVTTLMTNISHLQMASFNVYEQRELYLDHLNDMAEKLKLDVQGLGDIDPKIDNLSTIRSVCFKKSDQNEVIDPECQCQESNSCLGFDIDNLKGGQKASIDAANSILKGDIKSSSDLYRNFKQDQEDNLKKLSANAKTLSKQELENLYSSRVPRLESSLNKFNLSETSIDLNHENLLSKPELSSSGVNSIGKPTLTSRINDRDRSSEQKNNSNPQRDPNKNTLDFSFSESQRLSQAELDSLGLSNQSPESLESSMKKNPSEESSMENQIIEDRNLSIFERVSKRYGKEFPTSP